MTKQCNVGSFNWYLYNSGSFVTAMAKCITLADDYNIESIKKIYPQMVEAYRMKDWNYAPKNYFPSYDSIVI